jgi:hypothetical protein
MMQLKSCFTVFSRDFYYDLFTWCKWTFIVLLIKSWYFMIYLLCAMKVVVYYTITIYVLYGAVELMFYYIKSWLLLWSIYYYQCKKKMFICWFIISWYISSCYGSLALDYSFAVDVAFDYSFAVGIGIWWFICCLPWQIYVCNSCYKQSDFVYILKPAILN